MNRLRKAYKTFYEQVLKGGSQQFEQDTKKFDFKGQRFKDKIRDGPPGVTKEQYERMQKILKKYFKQRYQLDDPIKLQSREIRLKNVFYLGLYMSWFAGVILFVMYRLGNDELSEMEQEVEARLKLRESIKSEAKYRPSSK